FAQRAARAQLDTTLACGSVRARSRMVAVEVRRRMLARRTLPPRYLGGYGSREGSPSRFPHRVGNHFEFSERLRVGALHGGQLVAPARLVRLSFGTKALTRTRRRAAAPNPPWR